MLAACFSDADEISLMVNRLTIIAVCSWGAIFCGCRAFKRHAVSTVSRVAWVFPTATMAALTLLVADFTIRCQEELSTWERTVYGGLLIWTIAGLLGVIIAGHREVEKAVALSEKYRDELSEAVKVLDRGGGDE